MTVKDKNNLVSYNVWSGGDYDNSADGFTASNTTIELSNQYSVNYKKSIKFTKTTNDNIFISFDSNRYSCNPNKEYICSLDLKLVNCTCQLNFMILNSNITEIRRVKLNVPETNNHCTLPITGTDDTSYVRLLIRLEGSSGGIMYIDNINIIET